MSSTLNIRIKDETLQQTDRLKKRFGAPSRSDVIRRAVEGKEGRREVILPGLKK